MLNVMSRLHRGWALIAVGLLLAASIGAAYATGRLPGRETAGGDDPPAAAGDEEWLALIESARQARANPAAPWPDGPVQEGVKVLYSCGAVRCRQRPRRLRWPSSTARTEVADAWL